MKELHHQILLLYFISIEDFNNKINEEVDFTYFDIIGFEDFFTIYEINTNWNYYNHGIYGLFDENHIEGIKNIVTQNFWQNQAIIKK